MRKALFPVLLLVLVFSSTPAAAAEEINVKNFGAQGNGTVNDTAAIQKAINAAFNKGQGLPVYFPPGAYKITKPLILERSVDLVGGGIGWGSVIQPVNSDGIHIDGDLVEGGWAFKNRIQGLNIDMTQAPDKTAIKINKAYSIRIVETYIHAPYGKAANVPSLSISRASHITLQDVTVFGGADNTGRGVGLALTDAWVSVYDIDVEGYLNNIVVTETGVAKGKLAMYGGHLERFGQFGIKLQGSSYNLISGVRITMPMANQIGIGFHPNGSLQSSNNTIIGCSILFPEEMKKVRSRAASIAAYGLAKNNIVQNSLVQGVPHVSSGAEKFIVIPSQ